MSAKKINNNAFEVFKKDFKLENKLDSGPEVWNVGLNHIYNKKQRFLNRILGINKLNRNNKCKNGCA